MNGVTAGMSLCWDDGPSENEAPLTDVGEVRRRLTALDGEHRTIVTIAADGEAHLGCGGDNRLGLVLYVTADNQVFHTLINETAASGADDVVMVAGGQPGRYPARQVVPLEVAVAAAEYYATHRDISPELAWDTT
ncbi:Imm1 family immunity protein [Jiangella alkaliphila]|uniref:Immunity protein Imm1 n=1 Tax=Jiangella alkaliphila TaxID=419479 RepID=A0A1H2KLC1_9ACTN|nr:Imm1 family immunity protein [Jiangella alkaliphila]SDU69507.1 Immunity protein Imm1 [Jiangella alkaliphila]